ncbi:LysM peptidoglycan-binding domain-containing protein [Patescibacteria group bacterium]|nr:LysM peptidoglycan-binding domain-containing protein [Patescibacteria group bacterium]
MFDNLRKFIDDLDLNESIVSMLLGALIVILIGILAYGYFRNHQPNSTMENPQNQEEQAGELATPSATVALPTTHVVENGESLWSIAERYYSSGYNWQDIAKANNLTNPSEIEPGQKLTIPKVEVREPQTTNTALEQTVTPANSITGNSYTVVHGDNLWDIAVRAYGDGFKWTQIAQANHLANPEIIHAGNVFTIPR